MQLTTQSNTGTLGKKHGGSIKRNFGHMTDCKRNSCCCFHLLWNAHATSMPLHSAVGKFVFLSKGTLYLKTSLFDKFSSDGIFCWEIEIFWMFFLLLLGLFEFTGLKWNYDGRQKKIVSWSPHGFTNPLFQILNFTNLSYQSDCFEGTNK